MYTFNLVSSLHPVSILLYIIAPSTPLLVTLPMYHVTNCTHHHWPVHLSLAHNTVINSTAQWPFPHHTPLLRHLCHLVMSRPLFSVELGQFIISDIGDLNPCSMVGQNIFNPGLPDLYFDVHTSAALVPFSYMKRPAPLMIQQASLSKGFAPYIYLLLLVKPTI